MDIFGKFGIETKLLIVQIFNFIILLVILQKVLYKPVIEMLENRRKKLKQSAEKLEEIEKHSKELERKTQQDLEEAREKSHEIIARAQKQASETKQHAQEEAVAQAEEILSKAKKSIEAEKESLINSVQEDIAHLVVNASSKVLDKEIKDSEEEFILKEIKKIQS